jgi:hypothetical protein
MFSRSARQRHLTILLVAAVAAMELGAPARPRAQNLVANPVLARDLPPPGWIGDHRDAWVKQHPVYASTCETNEASKEIRFLNRTVAYDEYLLSLTNQSDAGNPAATNLAQVARASIGTLRHDIVVIDGLVAQLRLLPPCDGSPAPPATNAVAVGSAAIQPAQNTSVQSATAPTPSAAAEPAATLSAKAAEPEPAAEPDTPAASDRLIIRFDDRLAALTPSSIRALNKAITAAKSGKPVQLTIEGCDANADFSSGAPCAKRLYSIENRLEEAGVKNPKRLFGDLP